MRNLFVLLMVVLLFAGCTPSEKSQVEIGNFTQYFLFPETLNGKVKEVSTTAYYAREENGDLVKVSRISAAARDTIGWIDDFLVQFDEEGRMIKSATLNEMDEEMTLSKLVYEEDRLVKVENYRKGTLNTFLKAYYDEEGREKGGETFSASADTLMWSVTAERDENGTVRAWNYKNYKGDPMWRYEITDDDNGNRINWKSINPNGELYFQQNLSYDERGHITAQYGINRNGNRDTCLIEYEFDEMDNWIVEKCRNNDAPHFILTEQSITYYDE